MPKMKTHRGAAKRFSFTGTGKIKRAQAFRRHLLAKKRQKRKRRLQETGLVTKADSKRIKKLLPYA